MGLHPLAVVGHVGPDFSGETMDEARALAALAALGQATRLSIFRLLVRKEPAGMTAGALAEAVGCPHNTLSTHVAILARAGLVIGRREGRTINYRADSEGTRALIAFLVMDCCEGRPELCGLSRAPEQTACGCPHKEASEQKRTAMTWTFTYFVIEIIAGAIGGCTIAAAAKEYNFGILGHVVTGALGGAFSGYFLQSIASTVVDSTGEVYEASDQLTQWFVQAIAGLVAGAILTMGVGFAKHTIEHHRPGRG